MSFGTQRTRALGAIAALAVAPALASVLIPWMPLVSEWMHDWANPRAADLVKEVYGKYDPLLAM